MRTVCVGLGGTFDQAGALLVHVLQLGLEAQLALLLHLVVPVLRCLPILSLYEGVYAVGLTRLTYDNVIADYFVRENRLLAEIFRLR